VKKFWHPLEFLCFYLILAKAVSVVMNPRGEGFPHQRFFTVRYSFAPIWSFRLVRSVSILTLWYVSLFWLTLVPFTIEPQVTTTGNILSVKRSYHLSPLSLAQAYPQTDWVPVPCHGRGTDEQFSTLTPFLTVGWRIDGWISAATGNSLQYICYRNIRYSTS
jgi:hypothetical protein